MKRGIGFLFALFVSVAAAADKDDPGGWTNAKWGMTEAEVRSAVPAAVDLTTPIDSRTWTNATTKEKWVSTLGIPALDLRGGKWIVCFLFGPDKGLSRVILEPNEKARVSAQEFQSLEALLADKYGRPFDREVNDFPATHNAQWSFPSTVIELKYTDYRSRFPMESLSLTYDRRATRTSAPI